MSTHDRNIRVFDRESSRAVDRAAVEQYGMPGIVLMENAARALAASALDMLGGESSRVLIVCGGGNNGGDGYALARHLHNAGADVTLCAVGEPKDGSDAAVNAGICGAMGLPRLGPDDLHAAVNADLLVDALFGTGLDRAIEGPAADLVDWMNTHGAPTLAVDTPSGLDCDTGRPYQPCIRAARTVSFLGWKQGFLAEGAEEFTGAVDVGDIGCPRELLQRFGRPLQEAQRASRP